MTELTTLLLASVGLTVLVVWPESGPAAAIRDRILRPLLPKAHVGVLDCYICTGFWAGLVLSPIWWIFTSEFWCWFSCLMTPGLFWTLLGNPSSLPAEEEGLHDE